MEHTVRWVNQKVPVAVIIDQWRKQDIGYASSQNAPNKGIAIDKARKAATTDAMKRTLKNFGNALGNCLYDKSYLQGVAQMANPQVSSVHLSKACPSAALTRLRTRSNSRLSTCTDMSSLSPKTLHLN